MHAPSFRRPRGGPLVGWLAVGALVLAGCAARPGLEGDPRRDARGTGADSARAVAGAEWVARGHYVLTDARERRLAVDSFRVLALPDGVERIESYQVGPGDRVRWLMVEVDEGGRPLRAQWRQEAYGSRCEVFVLVEGGAITVARRPRPSSRWRRYRFEAPRHWMLGLEEAVARGRALARLWPRVRADRLRLLGCRGDAAEPIGWGAVALDSLGVAADSLSSGAAAPTLTLSLARGKATTRPDTLAVAIEGGWIVRHALGDGSGRVWRLQSLERPPEGAP